MTATISRMTTYVDHDTWTVLKRDDSDPPAASQFITIDGSPYAVSEVLTDDQGRSVVKCFPPIAPEPVSSSLPG